MILFCRLAVVSTFTSFLYVHDCPDKHGAQQTHFSVVTGFLTNFQTPEGHNNFQVLFDFSSYSQTSRKRPPKIRRFSSRLRQVDASLRSKRFRAVSGQRTRARAKDRTKNGAKATSGQNRKSQSSSFLGLSLLRNHTETLATQPIPGRLREVVANLPTGVLPRRRPNTSTFWDYTQFLSYDIRRSMLSLKNIVFF